MTELRMPCEVCGLYEEGEHFDQVGDWCDGAGSRPASASQLVAALIEERVGEVLETRYAGEYLRGEYLKGEPGRFLVVPLGEDA